MFNQGSRLRQKDVGEAMSNFNDDLSRHSVEKTSFQLLKAFGGNIDLDMTQEY